MSTIEERVTKLESAVFGAHESTLAPQRDDWQKSVGIVTDDEITREIIDGALRLRQSERDMIRSDDGS